MRIRSLGDPDAPILVLIHGLSSSRHSWQRNLAALGARRRLLIADLFPPAAGPRFSVASEATELRQVLERERRPVAVIGHSLGGLIAMRLAAEATDLVERIILVAVPGATERRALPSLLAAVAASGARTDLRSVAVVAGTVLSANPIQLLAATRASVRIDQAAGSSLAMPCLLVWGAGDAIVPVQVGIGLAAAIPDARLAVIADAGHQPQWDRPDAFHAVVLPFLDAESAA